MKSAIIIGLVIVAVVTIVGVKVFNKQCGTSAQSSCCPCSMLKTAQSNQVETGSVPIE